MLARVTKAFPTESVTYDAKKLLTWPAQPDPKQAIKIQKRDDAGAPSAGKLSLDLHAFQGDRRRLSVVSRDVVVQRAPSSSTYALKYLTSHILHSQRLSSWSAVVARTRPALDATKIYLC